MQLCLNTRAPDWLASAAFPQFSPSTRLPGGAAGVAALAAELDIGKNLVLVSKQRSLCLVCAAWNQ